MKPILRDIRTGLYFQGGASWTISPEAAFVYADIEAALDAAHGSMMTSLELNVLLFDDPRYTIRLPVHEFLHPGANPSRPRSRCASSGANS
jgi:hypothetical protein